MPQNIDHIKLDPNNTKPAYLEGLAFYDKDEKTIAVFNDESDVTHQLGQEGFIRVYNDSGALIGNGSVVYISGAEMVENRATIAKAQADAQSTSEVVGFATHDIANNSFGYITYWGLVNDLDTSSFTSGDIVYLSESTAGAVRIGPPPAGNFDILLGYVVRSHATEGRILAAITPKLASTGGAAGSRGNMYISTSAETSIGTIDTPVKVGGTYTGENEIDFTHATGRLTYDGIETRVFEVTVSVSLTTAGNNKLVSFYIAKNGSVVSSSRIQRKTSTGADVGALALVGSVSLATTDYIEIFAENNSDNTNLTAEFMYVSIK